LKQRILQQWQSVGADAGKVLSVATHSGLHLLAWFVRLMLILVVTFYLLRDWDDIISTAGEIIPGRYRDRASRLAHEVDVTLGRLLRGQLSVMLSLALIYTVGLSFIGLDLALPIGVMTGFMSFIPYLGFFTGLLTASLAGLLQYHTFYHLLLVFAVFGFAEVMESMVLGPRLVGRSIGFHPIVVIFAVLTGGRLFGFAGILLALPVSAVLMVWLRHVHERYQRSVWSE
jgi:predicted PurR-regulated permease PerM